jgi:hypothetical protein
MTDCKIQANEQWFASWLAACRTWRIIRGAGYAGAIDSLPGCPSMSNFREFDRETRFLLPPSLDEWLPERNYSPLCGVVTRV